MFVFILQFTDLVIGVYLSKINIEYRWRYDHEKILHKSHIIILLRIS